MKIKLGIGPVIEYPFASLPEIVVLTTINTTEYYHKPVVQDGCYNYSEVVTWIQLNDIPRYRDLWVNGADSTHTDEKDRSPEERLRGRELEGESEPSRAQEIRRLEKQIIELEEDVTREAAGRLKSKSAPRVEGTSKDNSFPIEEPH